MVVKNYRGDKICLECGIRFPQIGLSRMKCCSNTCWDKRRSRQTTRGLNKKSANTFNGIIRYFKLVNDIHDLKLPLELR